MPKIQISQEHKFNVHSIVGIKGQKTLGFITGLKINYVVSPEGLETTITYIVELDLGRELEFPEHLLEPVLVQMPKISEVA